VTLPPQPSLMDGGSSRTLLEVDKVCMNISPPWEARRWDMALPPLLRAISSMTERPLRRKLMRQEEGRLFTSTGVIRCIAVQFCISLALQPRGVHHLRVTVSYSVPSSKRRKVFTKAESWGLPMSGPIGQSNKEIVGRSPCIPLRMAKCAADE
jgi:hypothetical protein